MTADHLRRGGSDRGTTVTKRGLLILLGLALSEKQIPQVLEKFESGGERKEALERAVMLRRRVGLPSSAGPVVTSRGPIRVPFSIRLRSSR